MRLILIFLVVLVAVGAAAFAALNATRAPIDFYVWHVELPIGAALLATLALGWLLGGLVAWVGQVPRLRRALRAAERELRAARTPGADA
ncbi:MAG TPA: lipopolysaccharide assembly protein LapA domain-containing protein [Dokdonella sp.]